MVRVGGGWCALDEFLVKNDPCRGKWHMTRVQSKRPSCLPTKLHTLVTPCQTTATPQSVERQLY